MPTEANTTLMVRVLIDGKEILLHALHNEEVTKGVIRGGQMYNTRGYKLSMRPPS